MGKLDQNQDCLVSFNGDFYHIETYSGYSLLMADPDAPEFFLEPSCSDDELGRVVLTALKNSRRLSIEEAGAIRMVAQELYKRWVEKVMSMYSYKNKRAMFKNMASCSLRMKENVIEICPSNHEKLDSWSGDGISKDDYVYISADEPAEKLGAAVRLAFTRCI